MVQSHLENTFYSKSPQQQKQYLVVLACKALLLNMGIFLVLFLLGLPIVLVVISIWASLQVLAPFYDVPAMVKAGKLIYHSPLFLAEKATKNGITLHGGSLFDYHFTINKAWSAKRKTNFVIQQYLVGLLNLVETTQDDVVLTGTSYVLNTSTAERLGFKKVRTHSGQTIILFLNAINLMCSASIIKGRWVMPPIYKVNSYQGTVKDIKDNQDFIRALIKRLA